MKLFGSTKEKINKDNKSKNVPQLENIEVALAHCNLINNKYQHDSRVLSKFVSNRSFGQLIKMLSTNHIYTKTFISEFSYIGVWFVDQNSKPLEIEDKSSLTLAINDRVL